MTTSFSRHSITPPLRNDLTQPFNLAKKNLVFYPPKDNTTLKVVFYPFCDDEASRMTTGFSRHSITPPLRNDLT
ncbi:hypothetical protein ACLOJK_022447 [Asimina triloba]